jgi:hypothetical protein
MEKHPNKGCSRERLILTAAGKLENPQRYPSQVAVD